MAFDDLKPQPPRTRANSREPERAIAYAERALALSRAAAARCRTVLDVPFGADDYQKLDLYLPAEDAAQGVPVLLFFHGGAWAHGYKEWNGFLTPGLVDLPAIFVTASYRLVPEHKFPAALEDAFAALAWVRSRVAAYGGDPERILVAGWSAGGTLAALITLRRDLYGAYGLPDEAIEGCLPSSSTFRVRRGAPAPGERGLSYGDFLLADPAEDFAASPIHYVGGNTTPFFISHGSDDFPHVEQSSREMVAALEKAGCPVEYRVYEGVDHYGNNLATQDSAHDWVVTARSWLRDGARAHHPTLKERIY